MNSNIELLRSLRQNIQNEEEISHEEFMSNQETVREIIENINVNLSSGERSFKYPVINMSGLSAEEILGEITQDEIAISMPDLQKQIEALLIPRAIKDATELKCAGMFCRKPALCTNLDAYIFCWFYLRLKYKSI